MLIFQKKFSTIKVLRGHIEQLPIPNWSESTLQAISTMVDEIINGKEDMERLDEFIMNEFELSADEVDYIKTTN